MAQQVRPPGAAGRAQLAGDDPVDRGAVEAPPAPRDEHRRPGGRLVGPARDQPRAPLGEPGAQGRDGGLGEGDRPRLAALADHPQRVVLEVEPGEHEVARLLAAQAAAVEHLDQGAVAQGEGPPDRRVGRAGADRLDEGRRVGLREARHRRGRGSRAVDEVGRGAPGGMVRREPLAQGRHRARSGRGRPAEPAEGRLQGRRADRLRSAHALVGEPPRHAPRVGQVGRLRAHREPPAPPALRGEPPLEVAQALVPGDRHVSPGSASPAAPPAPPRPSTRPRRRRRAR